MANSTKGADAVSKRLKRLANRGEVEKAALRALYVLGQKIELTAEKSITEGSISGKGHIPSLPGQPPNADSRDLDTKIETVIVAQSPPRVHVEAYSAHAVPLEFGTRKMAPRRYLGPATNKHRGEAGNGVAVQVGRLAK